MVKGLNQNTIYPKIQQNSPLENILLFYHFKNIKSTSMKYILPILCKLTFVGDWIFIFFICSLGKSSYIMCLNKTIACLSHWLCVFSSWCVKGADIFATMNSVQDYKETERSYLMMLDKTCTTKQLSRKKHRSAQLFDVPVQCSPSL